MKILALDLGQDQEREAAPLSAETQATEWPSIFFSSPASAPTMMQPFPVLMSGSR